MFTWHCKKKSIYCRLDYWLISDNLINQTNNVSIQPITLSDHNLITLTLNESPTTKRGPGYWKFNTTLLHDNNYINTIKNVIADSEKND